MSAGAQESRPLNPAGAQDSTVIDAGDEEEARTDSSPYNPNRPKGLRGAWKWFLENPFQRMPFAVFLGFAALTVVWCLWYLADKQNGYIAAGVSTIVIAGYGIHSFRILLSLREQVQELIRLNKEFKMENKLIRVEVDKLDRAHKELLSVEGSLQESNAKLKANLEKFKALDTNLKTLGEQSKEGLGKVLEESRKIIDKWHESSIHHERAILNKLFDKFEMKDNNPDMSKEEFEEFLAALPEEYSHRFEHMGKTFEELAGDDNMMQYEEFKRLTDLWVEEIGKAGGSCCHGGRHSGEKGKKQ